MMGHLLVQGHLQTLIVLTIMLLLQFLKEMQVMGQVIQEKIICKMLQLDLHFLQILEVLL